MHVDYFSQLHFMPATAALGTAASVGESFCHPLSACLIFCTGHCGGVCIRVHPLARFPMRALCGRARRVHARGAAADDPRRRLSHLCLPHQLFPSLLVLASPPWNIETIGGPRHVTMIGPFLDAATVPALVEPHGLDSRLAVHLAHAGMKLLINLCRQ